MIAPTLTSPANAPLFSLLHRARRAGDVTPAQLDALFDLAEAADTALGRLIHRELSGRSGDGRAVDVADETIGAALETLRLALAEEPPKPWGSCFNRSRGAALGAMLLAGEVGYVD